jgi:hypothetical protein
VLDFEERVVLVVMIASGRMKLCSIDIKAGSVRSVLSFGKETCSVVESDNSFKKCTNSPIV